MNRNPAQYARILQARTRVAEQLLWVEEHGRNLHGYISRYGDSDAPPEQRLGDGGQRIYEADRAELHERQAALDALLWRGPTEGQCIHGGRPEECGRMPAQPN